MKSRILLGILIVAIILICIFIGIFIGLPDEKQEKKEVEIVFEIEPDMFPESWLSETINAKATPISETEIARSEKILIDSMNKYPEKVLQENLDKVYVVHNLTFSGISAGGTRSSDCIYLANRGVSEGFTDIYIEQTFHSEFSSILLQNHLTEFNEIKWKEQNMEGFEYGESGINAIQSDNASTDFNDSFIQKGFLNQYSTSSLENDFNSIAQNMFKSKEIFWDIVDSSERIKNKSLLAIDFYHKLHPMFTEEYFREIS